MKTPNVPVKWNYRASVRKARTLWDKWGKVSLELLAVLREAKEQFSSQGYRSDLVSGETKLTWEGYLAEAGISRTTAWRWLREIHHFIPDDHQLEVEHKPRVLAPVDPVQHFLARTKKDVEKMTLLERLRAAAGVVLGR